MNRPRARIGLVTGQYPPEVGGVGQSAQRVARILAGAGFGVDVVVFLKRPTAVPLDESIVTTREGAITVHRVMVHRPPSGVGEPNEESEALTRYNREMFHALDHLQARERWDALHGFFLYPGGYIAGQVARMHGIPSIASIRGNDVGKFAFDPHRAPFVKAALDLADAVTSVATSLTTFADRTITPIAAKSATILNSVETAARADGPAPELGLSGAVIG